MRLRNGKSVDKTASEDRILESSASGILSAPTEIGDISSSQEVQTDNDNHHAGSNTNGNCSKWLEHPGENLIGSNIPSVIMAATTYTNGTNTMTGHTPEFVIRKDISLIRPHDKTILFILKLGGFLLFTMYFIVPTIIKLNPSIMSHIAFMHKIRVPLFANLEKPAELGMNGTLNFRIQTTDNLSLGAWHILPESQQDEATRKNSADLFGGDQDIVIYLHGNAGTRGTEHRIGLYKVLSKAGFHTIAVDYRGYGDSEGTPSEKGLVEDALAIFNWVKIRAGNAKVYFWGHSLGTGVATQAASRACQRGTHPDGLILEAPFTSIIDVAISHPLSTPFRYMPYFTWVFVEALKYNDIYFSNDKHITQVTVPILILHAKDDNIVPFHHGEKLWEVARNKQTKEPVHFVAFEASEKYGHDNIYKAVDLMRIVRDFITGQLRS